MEIDKKEVLRYLGYKNQKIDKTITDLIDECTKEIIDISNPRFVYETFDIERKDDKKTGNNFISSWINRYISIYFSNGKL